MKKKKNQKNQEKKIKNEILNITSFFNFFYY